MLLSPLPLSRLAAEVADFEAALADHPLAKRVLGRVKATLDFIEGKDISLSQHPDHQTQALGLLARFGLGISHKNPKQGVTWDGQAVAVDMEPSVIIHEVAHYQLAPPSRRRLVDFGLGAGPESGDSERSEADRRLFGVECDHEEARASLLGILWEAELAQPAILAFLEQNWLEGGISRHNLDHLIKTAGQLREGGYIDSHARPTMRLNSLSVCDHFAASHSMV